MNWFDDVDPEANNDDIQDSQHILFRDFLQLWSAKILLEIQKYNFMKVVCAFGYLDVFLFRVENKWASSLLFFQSFSKSLLMFFV